MAGDLHKPQTLALVLMVIAEISLFFSIISNAELQRFHHPMKNDDSVNLLVIGDWGRNGNYNQSQVAAQVKFMISCTQQIIITTNYRVVFTNRYINVN